MTLPSGTRTGTPDTAATLSSNSPPNSHRLVPKRKVRRAQCGNTFGLKVASLLTIAKCITGLCLMSVQARSRNTSNLFYHL